MFGPYAWSVSPTAPLQNRVDPWGRVVATPERGTLYGNRGVLHDPDGLIVRHAQVRRWISCELEFKGRRRTPLVQAGRSTGLFFLDEVTALAAGHRPCFECRRDDALSFQELWMRVMGLDDRPRADDMDRILQEERVETERALAGELTDGSMCAVDGQAFAVRDGVALPWSFGGYGSPQALPDRGLVEVLTCESIRRILAAGYLPRWHASGGG